MKIKISTILTTIFLIGALLFICFCLFRIGCLNYTYSGVCKVKYGNDWTSDYNKAFKRFCIHLNYSEFKIDNYAEYPDRDEIREICNLPKFFSFKGGNLCD